MRGEPGQASGADLSRVQSGVTSLLLTGALATAIVWGLVEQLHEVMFPVSDEVTKLLGQMSRTLEEQAVVAAAHKRQGFQRTALAIGIYGATVAALFAAVEGLRRGSWGRALTGFAAGTVLGGAFGALGGLAGVFVFQEFGTPGGSMNGTIATHATYWAVASIGIGLAFGVAARKWRLSARGIVLAAAGGLLAALIYPLLAAYVFPVEVSDKLVPNGRWNRLAWFAMTVLLTALIMGTADSTSRRQSRSSREAHRGA